MYSTIPISLKKEGGKEYFVEILRIKNWLFYSAIYMVVKCQH